MDEDHSIPLVEGRRTLRGAEAEPERLVTRAWGMSGPVRTKRTEQKMIGLCGVEHMLGFLDV